jgi:hypothetical protein
VQGYIERPWKLENPFDKKHKSKIQTTERMGDMETFLDGTDEEVTKRRVEVYLNRPYIFPPLLC